MEKINFRLLIINKIDSLGSITSKKTVLRAHTALATRPEEPRAHIV